MLLNEATRPTGLQRRRKIIFLWPYTNWGGAQVYFFAIMKLARRDWDIVTILPAGSSSDLLEFLDDLQVSYEFADIRADPRPEPTIKGKIRRQYERIRSELQIYRHLRRFELSDAVLHIEAAPWQSWQLLTALALRGAKTFVTLHNFRPEVSAFRAFLWKLRFQIVSRLPGFHIFASNVDTRDQLKAWVPRSFWKRIRVTYTCVDPAQIAKAGLTDVERNLYREKLGVRSDEFVVLAVGQFIDRKGRWVFIDAAAKARRNGQPIRFVWIMPQAISEEDLSRIQKIGLGDSFVPVVSSSIAADRIGILKFFNIADAFALPSFIEGLPIALLEAMALGIPSVSTNVYAIPEAINHDETGLLIEPGDGGLLYDAIVRLREDAHLRSKLAAAGREFVLRNFDERDAAAICIEEYRRAFAN